MSQLHTGRCLLRLSLINLLLWTPIFLGSHTFAEDITSEIIVLTLDDALKIANEHSRDLQLAQEYQNDVKGKYVEQRAAAFPQLVFNGVAMKTSDKAEEALSQGASPARVDVNSLDLGLTQALFTWGQVSAAIRTGKIGLATADEQIRLARSSVTRDVSTAFYDILLAKQMSEITHQLLQQKQRHADEAHRKFSAGTATDYDVLAADVAVENARPQVIQAENLVRMARDRFRFLLGLSGKEVDVSGELKTPEITVPAFDAALETALQNRPDYALLKQRTAISKELVKITGASDKPRLALTASTGWQQYELLDHKFDGENWSVGLALNWSIFDGLRTRGQLAQAKSNLASQQITEAQMTEGIELEVQNALNAVREAQEIASALSGTVTQAERLLTMAEHGYELGVMTRLELEDAMLNLTAARGSLAKAQHDFLVALANLRWTLGKDFMEEAN